MCRPYRMGGGGDPNRFGAAASALANLFSIQPAAEMEREEEGDDL